MVELQFSFVRQTRLVDHLLPIKTNHYIQYLKKARTPLTKSFDGLIFTYLVSILISHVQEDSDLKLSNTRNNRQIKMILVADDSKSPTVASQWHQLASFEASVKSYEEIPWQAVKKGRNSKLLPKYQILKYLINYLLASEKFSRAFCCLFCLTMNTFNNSSEWIFITISHATSLVNVDNKIIIGDHLGIIGFYLILRVEDPPQTER